LPIGGQWLTIRDPPIRAARRSTFRLTASVELARGRGPCHIRLRPTIHAGTGGLGLYGRDRNASDSAGAQQCVRTAPEPEDRIGHLGEALPFLLERIDESLSRNPKFGRSFREEFCRHFYVTTSGNFSTPALLCSIMELGIDRVLFSVDWPYVENDKGVEWMAKVPLSQDDKDKILFGNAKRLLRL
jgi:predicted TIM-barrel fold metal-dependent hydrolase